MCSTGTVSPINITPWISNVPRYLHAVGTCCRCGWRRRRHVRGSPRERSLASDPSALRWHNGCACLRVSPWQQAKCANPNNLAQHVGVRSVRNVALVVDEGVGHARVHLRQLWSRVPLDSPYYEAAWVLRAMVCLLNNLETPVPVSGDGKGDLRD